MGNSQFSKNIGDDLAFNRNEIELIKASWQSLVKLGLPELGLGLMTRILIEHKDLKSMWRRHNLHENNNHLNYANLVNPNQILKDHGDKVFSTINKAINSIDDLQSMSASLDIMGYQHYKFGTRNENFEIMGDALISTLSDALREHWNDQTKKVWIKLFRIIEFHMKTGMQRAEIELD